MQDLKARLHFVPTINDLPHFSISCSLYHTRKRKKTKSKQISKVHVVNYKQISGPGVFKFQGLLK